MEELPCLCGKRCRPRTRVLPAANRAPVAVRTALTGPIARRPAGCTAAETRTSMFSSASRLAWSGSRAGNPLLITELII